MSVPIHKQGQFLIVSFHGAISDTELAELQDNLCNLVGQHRSRGIIIDVSTLDVIDSYACRTIERITGILKLRGATTILVGIQPEVAFTMTQMGLKLSNIETAIDMEEGLLLLTELVNAI